MSGSTPSLDPETLPKVKFDNISYNGKPIIYVVKGTLFGCLYNSECRLMQWIASKTSIINYMKVLMLAEEMGLEYDVSVVRTKDEWYHAVHPERYVPAICDQDPVTQESFFVFESTACLQYLAETYDRDGSWSGRTWKEKAEVLNWVAYQTAGMGYV